MFVGDVAHGIDVYGQRAGECLGFFSHGHDCYFVAERGIFLDEHAYCLAQVVDAFYFVCHAECRKEEQFFVLRQFECLACFCFAVGLVEFGVDGVWYAEYPFPFEQAAFARAVGEPVAAPHVGYACVAQQPELFNEHAV